MSVQFIKATQKTVALAFFLIAGSFAQVLSTAPAPSDPIMGFETPSGWVVKSSSPLTSVATTSVRTQGSFGFALGNPSNPTTLTSAPVASTLPALTGVGRSGAVFEVDVMLPASDTGSLELFVTSASRGLKNQLIGEVDLTGLHPGIYNTLKFPIPEAVGTALGGAAFQDLSFQFVLKPASSGLSVSSSLSTGLSSKFLFDNLRVFSIPLVQAAAGVTLPANFGGSVDLVAIGDKPVTQTFTIATVQMPDSFHLLQGVAGSTTVSLALGYDGASTFTCTYGADPSDQTGQSYRVLSCTGGVQAGDLVGANYASLTIVGGAPSMEIQAQLAENPIGDLVGSGVIPPMPTFWGHSNGCVPAPVAGKVVTTTTACQNQVAEANQIVTNYFNAVNAAQPAPGWIITPVPTNALRNGTGLPDITPDTTASGIGNSGIGNTGASSSGASGSGTGPSSNDFPFDKEGHANKGGSFDAYWELNGDLNVSDNPTTASNTAHFNAAFSGHVVLFGNDVNVMSVNATADTANGKSQSATGSANVYLFGQELPGGGSVNASTGFNYNLSESTDLTVVDLDFWVFSLQVDATASASLNASGTLAATGLGLSVDPKVTMGTHIFGGIDVPELVSGGVEAKIDLLDVEAPVTAQAGLGIDLRSQDCDMTISFALNAEVTISALGGEIDAVATFGPCPFCWTGSKTIVKWDPIIKTTQQLFSAGPTTLPVIPLPSSVCLPPTPGGGGPPVGISLP